MCDLYDNEIDASKQFTAADIDDLVAKQTFDAVVIMNKCKDHLFHLECLEAQLGSNEYLDCSICMFTYGTKTGDMPPGTMSWRLQPFHCDGYKEKTWEIQYRFKGGVNPKDFKQFNGDARNAYIPDTNEGREVLLLLVRAFERRLTFTVGFSVVRGRDNCIVWNGIHHKTNTEGGSTRYGYPDPTYFNRVKLELALKGVRLDEDPAKVLLEIGQVQKNAGTVLSV